MEQWGKRLTLVMRDRGVSQREIAYMMDVSPQAVHKWVNSGEIENQKLRWLAIKLETNWIWLRYGVGGLNEAMSGLSSRDHRIEAGQSIPKEEFLDMEFHTAVCAALSLGSWEINFVSHTAYWSATTRTILHYGKEKRASQDIFRSLIRSQDVKAIDRSIAAAITDGLMFEQEFMLKHGSDLIVAVGKPIRGVSGKVEKIVGLMSDSVAIIKQLSVDSKASPKQQESDSVQCNLLMGSIDFFVK